MIPAPCEPRQGERSARWPTGESPGLACLLAAAMVLYACSDGRGDERGPKDADLGSTTSDFFSMTEPFDAEIALDREDWERLRYEGRSMPKLLSGCIQADYRYTYLPSEVSIAGSRVTEVAVRKKGYLGSLSVVRPSLRVDFGRDEHRGRRLNGTRRFTLNNNHQDPTNAKQCLTYELFAQAGLPAPRCGLAHVVIQGEPKGYYSNVEPIKKPFLRDRFGDDEGNLYEQVGAADFTDGRVDLFEYKTNERDNDGKDLRAVVQALEADDEDLLEALAEVFDLDNLFTHWAMEVITGHWDGWFGNQNNAYLYHSPVDDRFHLIPWGADDAFRDGHPLIEGVHSSVLAHNTIGKRLYDLPEGRKRYHQRLRELLDEVWDEEALIDKLDTIAELTEAYDEPVAQMKEFIDQRRTAIEAELALRDGDGPEVTTALPEEVGECGEPEPTEGRFKFVFDTTRQPYANNLNFRPLSPDDLNLDLPIKGTPFAFDPEAPLFQLSHINGIDRIQMGVVGTELATGRLIWIGFFLPESLYAPGEIIMHGFETLGAAVYGGDTTGTLAFVGGGKLVLEKAGREQGSPIVGTFKGQVAHVGDL